MVQLNPFNPLNKPDITVYAIEQKMFSVGVKTMPEKDKTDQRESEVQVDKAFCKKR